MFTKTNSVVLIELLKGWWKLIWTPMLHLISMDLIFNAKIRSRFRQSPLVGYNSGWINPCEQTCNQLLNPILTSFKTQTGISALLCVPDIVQSPQRPPREGQAHIAGIPKQMAL